MCAYLDMYLKDTKMNLPILDAHSRLWSSKERNVRNLTDVYCHFPIDRPYTCVEIVPYRLSSHSVPVFASFNDFRKHYTPPSESADWSRTHWWLFQRFPVQYWCWWNPSTTWSINLPLQYLYPKQVLMCLGHGLSLLSSQINYSYMDSVEIFCQSSLELLNSNWI